MKDPEEKILTHALREILEDESPLEQGADEFATRVRDTWERRVEAAPGPPERVNGSAHRSSPRKGPRATTPKGPRRTTPWFVPASAAAAVVLAGVGAWVLSQDGETDPPVVDDGGAVAKGGEATTGSGAGESATTTPDAPVAGPTRQRLAKGGTYALESRGATLAALDPAFFEVDEGGDLRVFDGRLEVATEDEALGLDLPGGARIDVEPKAALVVHVRRIDEYEDLSEASGAVEVDVLRGGVRVRGREIDEFGLAPESESWLALFEPGGLRVADAYERSIEERIREYGQPGMVPTIKREALSREFTDGLLALMREKPELWALASDAVEERLGLGSQEKGDAPWERGMWVGALAVDSSPVALRIARRAWREAPDVFSGESITAMAERGAFEFEREVTAWFDHMPRTTTDEEELTKSAPIASLLAMGGDARGIEILRQVVEPEVTADGRGKDVLTAPYMRAAAALSRLGDGAALEEVLAAHIDRARTALDDGDTEAASRAIDMLAYALALRDGEPLVPDAGPETPDWVQEARVGDIFAFTAAYHQYRQRQREAGEAEPLAEELARLAQR